MTNDHLLSTEWLGDEVHYFFFYIRCIRIFSFVELRVPLNRKFSKVRSYYYIIHFFFILSCSENFSVVDNSSRCFFLQLTGTIYCDARFVYEKWPRLRIGVLDHGSVNLQ